MKQKMQRCTLLYDIIFTPKDFEHIQGNFDMSKNIINFYRYVKHFNSEVISIHFLLTLIKGEIVVQFLK